MLKLSKNDDSNCMNACEQSVAYFIVVDVCGQKALAVPLTPVYQCCTAIEQHV